MVLRLDHFDDLTRSTRRAPVQPHRLARSIQIPFLKSFRELTTNRFVVRRDNREPFVSGRENRGSVV